MDIIKNKDILISNLFCKKRINTKTKILILGFGREGQSSFEFLRKLFPEKVFGIADRMEPFIFNSKFSNLVEKDKNIEFYLGKNYLKAIDRFDIVIKSPGISIHFPEIKKAFKNRKITSQTEIFLKNCPGKIIGITGTKGKSTTASLIYNILKESKKEVFLVGNIGKPSLSLLHRGTKNSIFVYELSSHQLYKLKRSPHIAVFLNLYKEHLDYYKSFSEYRKAKENITLWQKQGDYFIFNEINKEANRLAKKTKAKKISFSFEDLKGVINIEKNKLKGKFNLQNIAAAIMVAKVLKIPEKNIIKGIAKFKPLSHRLEIIGKFNGITFCNDSLSTIPESTIAAMEAFEGKVGTVILGGLDRGINFKKLAFAVLENRIEAVVLFPTTGTKIWKSIKSVSFASGIKLPKSFFTKDMKDAVSFCYKNTSKDKICLLSCASPSFNLFKDYKERGNLFKKWIEKLSKK